MSYVFCSKFQTLSSSAKIVKTGQDLTKLQTVERWELFETRRSLQGRQWLHHTTKTAKIKRCYYLAAHCHIVNVLTSNITARFGTVQLKDKLARDLTWRAGTVVTASHQVNKPH